MLLACASCSLASAFPGAAARQRRLGNRHLLPHSLRPARRKPAARVQPSCGAGMQRVSPGAVLALRHQLPGGSGPPAPALHAALPQALRGRAEPFPRAGREAPRPESPRRLPRRPRAALSPQARPLLVPRVPRRSVLCPPAPTTLLHRVTLPAPPRLPADHRGTAALASPVLPRTSGGRWAGAAAAGGLAGDRGAGAQSDTVGVWAPKQGRAEKGPRLQPAGDQKATPPLRRGIKLPPPA